MLFSLPKLLLQTQPHQWVSLGFVCLQVVNLADKCKVFRMTDRLVGTLDLQPAPGLLPNYDCSQSSIFFKLHISMVGQLFV